MVLAKRKIETAGSLWKAGAIFQKRGKPYKSKLGKGRNMHCRVIEW